MHSPDDLPLTERRGTGALVALARRLEAEGVQLAVPGGDVDATVYDGRFCDNRVVDGRAAVHKIPPFEASTAYSVLPPLA